MGAEELEVDVIIDKSWFALCESRTKRYTEEIRRLEKRLEESDHPEFWSVDSCFTHCKDNAVSDETIRDDFKLQGFKNLADKYGLAWIWQIYLPRKVNCGR